MIEGRIGELCIPSPRSVHNFWYLAFAERLPKPVRRREVAKVIGALGSHDLSKKDVLDRLLEIDQQRYV